METVAAILAVIAGITGIVGSILPALPGPPVSWVGLLLLYIWGGTNSQGEEMSLALLLTMLGLTIAVTVIDYFMPAFITRKTGGTKYAERGALAGMLIGMFFIPPFGMIIGSFLGAYLAEIYYARKKSGEAVKSAFGSFIGFLAGTGIKLIACGVMMYYIFVYMA